MSLPMSQLSCKRGTISPPSSKCDKKLRLGLTNEELEKMNRLLQDWVDMSNFSQLKVEDVSTKKLAFAFQQIVVALKGLSTIDKSWVELKKGEERISRLPREELLQLASMWLEAVEKGDWERLANHAILQAEAPTVESKSDMTGDFPRPREEQEAATEKSWKHPFQGDAAAGLRMHVETHYNSKDLRAYAHFSAIVQSSGMGKSRTVDELAKDCFVIPLNLREATSAGYPPADHSVRDYLTTPDSKDISYHRVCAFLEALFTHTATTLLGFEGQVDYVGFAKKFRSYMTEGQTMKGHNQSRENFYKRVVEMAKERLTVRMSAANQDFTPSTAFKELGHVLGLFPSSDKGKQKARFHDHVRLVFLAFDEAQTITQRKQAADEEWSIFNELRHALRRLYGLPLFSLFLLTSIQISQVTPPVQVDSSKRVVEDTLAVIQPYTDLGFDSLARVITADGFWNLEQLTEDSQIFLLGRPLFAARYLEGSYLVKRGIIQFAAAKLLNADYATANLSDHQALACLSRRLPIEFNSTSYDSREQEKRQVEAHMRICIRVGAHFETMTTTSSSEPILSEAAYFVMQRASFNAPKALKSVMEGFSICKGDRGEFLALLLLTLARDSAVGPADVFGRPITGRRWFGLADFLYGQLFRQQTLSSKLVDEETLMALCQLSKDFPNAQLHFSHFVKVHEHSAIDLESLLLLQGRGAAVLCAGNQIGLDAINVFLKDGTKLVQENAGLGLLQMKNDARYSSTPQQNVFDAMDPYYLEILEEGFDAVPLIKIVFALAATKPALHVVRHAPSPNYSAVIYEIWCAGISPDFLEPIKTQDVGIWDSLLEASYGWKDIYKTTSTVTANLRKSATPGVARDAGHYSCWASRLVK